MPFQSQFSRRTNYVPPARSTPVRTRLDWRGLDMASPHDVVEDNRTPWAKNFRIYAQEGDDRRVAITSRKGAGEYVVPLNETVDSSVTAVTGAADASIGVETKWKAMKFTAASDKPLTMVELNLKKDSDSRGPVIVEIYDDDSGSPDNLLASSSILGSEINTTYGYVGCRFVEAPDLTNTNTYWVVAYIQDDGSGNYYWSSTTAGTDALTSDSGGVGWDSTAYSLNMKVYVADDKNVTGLNRYAPSNSDNATLIGIGTSVYEVNDTTGALTEIISGLDAATTELKFTYADDKTFITNGIDDIQTWDGTTAGTITHGNIGTVRLGTFHKNRFFAIEGDNQLVYSEDPGNDDGAGNEWYEAFLSTSFIYIPTAKASDPITAIVSFQDNLVVFTASDKYVLYGSDPGSFTVRQAMGRKGAVSNRGVYADENYIYFVAKDGIYRYNGASDELISDRVQPEFESIANLNNVVTTKWKRKVRFYYASSGSSVNDRCLIWDNSFEEWMLDTDAYTSYAVPFKDADDDGSLVEASSTAPTAYFAEQNDHNLGKAIDFEYFCKYDSMDNPAQRKRIVRFYPMLEAEGGDYPIGIGMDKDRKNQTTYQDYEMTSGGETIGDFNIGDSVFIGSETEFEPSRVRISGYGYYWQVRVKRKGVNNPVQFIGYVLSYRTRTL